MKNELRPYPEYKSVDIPWLDKVPAHWEMQRMKHLFAQRNIRGFPHEPMLAATQTKGVVRKDEYENRTVMALKDLHLLKLVEIGDFVISLRSFQGGIEYARHRGIISPAYTILYQNDASDHGYYASLFKSRPFIGGLRLYVTGIRQGQNIDYTRLSRSYLPLPPLSEQKAISAYVNSINHRCARFIRNRRRLIEVLNEQKQAIINRAVTRGLDPDVSLKPSGIDWLGDIPAHWNLGRLGLFIDLLTGFPFKSSGFTEDVSDIRLLRGINVAPDRVRWDSVVRWPSIDSVELAAFVLKEGDIVFGMDRPVISGGTRVAMIGSQDVPSLLLQRVARIRVREELDQRYLLLLLQDRRYTDYLASIFTGISVPHISPTQISDYRVALPPLEEQRAILYQVKEETQAGKGMKERAEREIRLIREYRTRLISDVVTGKVDVRHLAPAPGSEDLEESMEALEPLDEATGELSEDAFAGQVDV